MKNIGTKKLQTSTKGTSLVKKSSVQKPSVKKKPTQARQKKMKDADANLSIKEKLSGKIFSPTVEKAKTLQQKKVTNSTTGKIKTSPAKQKVILATSKKKILKTKSEVNEEKTVQNSKKQAEHLKNEKEVISEITKKQKVNAPKVEKTVNDNKDKVEFKGTASTKRKLKSELLTEKVITEIKKKLKSEQPEIETKKVETEVVKEECGNSTVSLDVKKENHDIVAKPRRTKFKRKSSVISSKDLKPISNIKSLVKRPVKKISEAKIKKRLASFPERGVCYFSRIPHGFYEKELKKYCSQFGKVTGVYHPVSKTGNSRGYAFVEFEHKEVAEVVAETMNNYLMFNRLVKCQYIPPEMQRPWVFRQERNNKKAANLRRKENLQKQMRKLSNTEVQKWKKKRQMRVKSFHKKLEKLGVDYEFQVNDTNKNEATLEKKDE